MNTYKADYSSGTVTVGTGSIDSATGNIWWDNTTPNPLYNYLEFKNEKEKEDMMYLWEVYFVNPKDNEFYIFNVVGKTRVTALIAAYDIYREESNENDPCVAFDDLKKETKELLAWEDVVK